MPDKNKELSKILLLAASVLLSIASVGLGCYVGSLIRN